MTDLRKAAEMALKALDYEAREEPESIWIAERDALRQALAEDALDRMVAENQRLGLYENTPAVKTYCGGKPNYCTPEVAKRKTLAELLASTPVDETVKHEYVLDCPRCGHCCQQREWVGLTDADIAHTMHGSVEGSSMLPY